VADAFPEVLRAADYVLSKAGGQGALRELCDLILK
jgi:3-deoxy-D-manno-octulosonate 8-phosphate phosphatase KdsC-like HAD superfamily phosphatase